MITWAIWLICWAAFLLGAMLCINNLWLALRLSIHMAQGKSEESYRHVSGIPMIGSGLVGVSLLGLYDAPGMLVVGILIIVFDPVGLLWGMVILLYLVWTGAFRKA